MCLSANDLLQISTRAIEVPQVGGSGRGAVNKLRKSITVTRSLLSTEVLTAFFGSHHSTQLQTRIDRLTIHSLSVITAVVFFNALYLLISLSRF